MQKMAPPPHVNGGGFSVVRVSPAFTACFPRGATFNIVGPNHAAYVDVRVSNNIENGTSAARDSFPHGPPFSLSPFRPCSLAPPLHGRAYRRLT